MTHILSRFSAIFLFVLAFSPHVVLAQNNPTPFEYSAQSARVQNGLLLDVALVDKRLVAVGQHGHIIYSDDTGNTWVQAVDVPTRSTLTDIIFLDSKTGFAVGHDSVILRTQDAGETWQLQYSERRGEDPLFGVHFTNQRHGIAVGAFSRVLETQDGGKTWAKRTLIEGSFDDFHLNGIFADRHDNIYIPAEFGAVYKSTDKGRTFTAIETPYEGSFWGGMALDNDNILIWGMRGNAFMSANEGKLWNKVTTNTDRSITGGVQLRNGDVVLTGLSGLVLVSDDEGESFAPTVRSDRLSFGTAAASDTKDTVLLFGVPGIVRHELSN
ncbi:MAG: hypothetical protein HAW64_03755 [Alphaproteobacteria bacterium]|nr:hypothetical protein [Alphaproteobacteria bacterium]